MPRCLQSLYLSEKIHVKGIGSEDPSKLAKVYNWATPQQADYFGLGMFLQAQSIETTKTSSPTARNKQSARNIQQDEQYLWRQKDI